MWWAIVTMTTIGYGDEVPETALGKILACFTALFGILIIALPVAIVGNKF
jgi:voltage-gated potassium channel